MNNMKINNIEKVLIRLVLIFNIPIYLYLFVYSFLYSYISVDVHIEDFELIQDSIYVNILGIILLLGLFYLFSKIVYKYDNNICTNKIAVIVAAVGAILSIAWVFTCGATPEGDQELVVEAANFLNAGNYVVFEQESYLAKCPQQLGLVTILRLLFIVFGPTSYNVFRLLNCIGVFFIIYSLYKIASIISSQNSFVEIATLFVSLLYIPILFYTPFVYGEVLFVTFMLMAFVEYLQVNISFSWPRVILLCCFSGMAVLLKMNAIISIIAMVGILVIKLIFSDKRKNTCIILLAIIVGVVGQSMSMKMIYDRHIPDGNETIPNILFISMGMNDKSFPYYGSGWYDGSTYGIFKENGYDSLASSEEAKRLIREFIEKCKDNPSYALDFYNRKISTQWSAPMCQAIIMSGNITKNPGILAQIIYSNRKVWNALEEYMNIIQLLMYFSTGIFVLYHIAKKEWKLEYYVGFITVFGGFLFTAIWEAKARYVFPYMVILIPYVAIGISSIIHHKYNRT